jgi:hypothetical protein
VPVRKWVVSRPASAASPAESWSVAASSSIARGVATAVAIAASGRYPNIARASSAGSERSSASAAAANTNNRVKNSASPCTRRYTLVNQAEVSDGDVL